MWQRNLQDAWLHDKKNVGHMWNHAVKWAGQIDHAMGVGKRVFGAMHPMIEDMGGSDMNRAMMQGFGNFDRARHDVLGMHNNVEAQLHRLRRAAPEIGL
jgi:hypothetical protein